MTVVQWGLAALLTSMLLLAPAAAVNASDGAQIALIENDILKVFYSLDKNAMRIEDKRNGKIYAQAGYPEDMEDIMRLDSNVISAKIKLGGIPDGADVKVSFTKDDPQSVDVEISGNPLSKINGSIAFPPRFISEKDQFLLIPRGEGVLWPVEDKAFDGWWHVDLSWSGSVDLKTGAGYQMIYETPFDVSTNISSYKNLMTLSTAWLPSKGMLGYSRKLSYRFYDSGGYVAMAKHYGKIADSYGYSVGLKEKAKKRPVISRLIGAVDLWPMSDDVKSASFFRRLRLLGIDRALVSLGTGWRGPEGISDLIDFINSKGYLTSRYDIYTDVWNSDDNPPEWARIEGYPEDVIRGSKDEMQKGWVIDSDGAKYQGYYTCSLTQKPVAEERIDQDLTENHYNARFIDVITASSLYECYHPEHPTTREQDAKARADMLRFIGDKYGFVMGSEQSREWAMPYTEFGEGTMSVLSPENSGYDWMTPIIEKPKYKKENCDGAYRVPLVSLTYHSSHISTWYTGDGYQKVPDTWRKKELLNILYGSMPLWMFDGQLWSKYQADFVASYQNVNTLFKSVGYDELTDHRFLTSDRKVQQSEFSSGMTITANFGADHYDIGALPDFSLPNAELSLPEDGFIAQGNGIFAFRGIVDADSSKKMLNIVRTSDRIYMDPMGEYWDIGPLASKSMVILHSEGSLDSAKRAWMVVLGQPKTNATDVIVRPNLVSKGWSGGIVKATLLDDECQPMVGLAVKNIGSALSIKVPTSPDQFSIVELTIRR